MSIGADQLIAAFCHELRPSQGVQACIQQAEAEGYAQIARLFRAMVTSKAVVEHQMRRGPAKQPVDLYDYFVCPTCGLIFDVDVPEECPVDDTPGAQFVRIR